MKHDWGYRLLGLCAILFGGVTVAAHEFGGIALGNGAPGKTAFWIAALAYIAGGILIQMPRTLRFGAAVLSVALGASSLLYIYAIVTQISVPGIWDGLFERLGFFAGAFIVFVRASDRPNARLLLGLRMLFGVCVVSYTLAQAVFLSATAADVPKWIPPGQMFWAIATTIAFALAAVSLLTGYLTLLASQLLTLMILIFGVTIWIPRAWTNPTSLFVWSELGWTFAIAATAWVLADWLRSRTDANAAKGPVAATS